MHMRARSASYRPTEWSAARPQMSTLANAAVYGFLVMIGSAAIAWDAYGVWLLVRGLRTYL